MGNELQLQDYISLWNSVSLTVLDVRHVNMSMGDELRSYRFPASTFLYVCSGGARLALDGVERKASCFYVLHGGKGACLDIELTEPHFEYYILFYKAALPPQSSQDHLRLIKKYTPFQLQYGVAMLHPVPMMNRMEQMQREWSGTNMLEKLHVKVLLYQFVHEVLNQLDLRAAHALKPSLSTQIIRYIDEHYHKPITRESIARLFHYHTDYMSRQFKAETGRSLIDYLISVRIDRAGQLLRTMSMSVKDAAANVGYADTSYFIRIFKKQTGMTPMQYKDQQEWLQQSP